MYRVLKNDSLMVSFYAWNRADLFLNAWKTAGFRVVGHIVFAKSYASKSTFVGYTHESAYLLAKGRPQTPDRPIPDVIPEIHGQPTSPDGEAGAEPAAD
jgi:site-specific DNA-methyltransferase (adenine-specific)